MPKWLWFLRWQVARWMVHTALQIAPAGAARDLLVRRLNEYGREIMIALRPTPTQGED